jgi:CheY-like chemotaxis protein
MGEELALRETNMATVGLDRPSRPRDGSRKQQAALMPQSSAIPRSRDVRIGEQAPTIGHAAETDLLSIGVLPDSQTASRIFIIEDNPSVRNVISLVLLREGYGVLTALQGAAALRRIAEWHPHLILLDMMMPVMDGPEFVRAYREAPGPHVPIVAVTGAPHRALDIGVDYVLRKPVDIDELLQIIRRFIRPDAGSSTVA